MTNIIYLTGMSGAGKTTVSALCSFHGIPGIYTGDLHPQTTQPEKIYYGDRFGETGFIERVVEEALRRYQGEELLLIDGIRSLAELEYVRHRDEPAHVIAVVSPLGKRLERVRLRNGSTDYLPARERRDIGLDGSRFNIGAVIALADHYINNTGDSLSLDEQVEGIIGEIRNGIRDKIPHRQHR